MKHILFTLALLTALTFNACSENTIEPVVPEMNKTSHESPALYEVYLIGDTSQYHLTINIQAECFVTPITIEEATLLISYGMKVRK